MRTTWDENEFYDVLSDKPGRFKRAFQWENCVLIFICLQALKNYLLRFLVQYLQSPFALAFGFKGQPWSICHPSQKPCKFSYQQCEPSISVHLSGAIGRPLSTWMRWFTRSFRRHPARRCHNLLIPPSITRKAALSFHGSRTSRRYYLRTSWVTTRRGRGGKSTIGDALECVCLFEASS